MGGVEYKPVASGTGAALEVGQEDADIAYTYGSERVTGWLNEVPKSDWDPLTSRVLFYAGFVIPIFWVINYSTHYNSSEGETRNYTDLSLSGLLAYGCLAMLVAGGLSLS